MGHNGHSFGDQRRRKRVVPICVLLLLNMLLECDLALERWGTWREISDRPDWRASGRTGRLNSHICLELVGVFKGRHWACRSVDKRPAGCSRRVAQVDIAEALQL